MKFTYESKTIDKSIGCYIVIMLMIFNMIVGAFAWPYLIGTWSAWFGNFILMPKWIGAMLGLFLGKSKYLLSLSLATWLIF